MYFLLTLTKCVGVLFVFFSYYGKENTSFLFVTFFTKLPVTSYFVFFFLFSRGNKLRFQSFLKWEGRNHAANDFLSFLFSCPILFLFKMR